MPEPARLPPLEAARAFVDGRYPDCAVALLAGSAARGADNAASDLDLLLFDDAFGSPFRRTFEAFGWIVEVFAIPPADYPFLLADAADSGLPTLLRLCMDGIALRDDGRAEQLRREAEAAYAAGPAAWSERELAALRYQVSDYIRDLEAPGPRAERLYVAARLAVLAAELHLRAGRQWIGDGKWLHRMLARSNPALAAALTRALDRFGASDEAGPLLALIRREVLGPLGGPLAAGFAEGDTMAP